MIVLAVLLLLAVALVVLFVVVTGITPTVQLEWSQISTSVTLTALAVFLLGAACLLLAELGLALLLRGNRKNWERRRELKRLRRVEAERARHAGPSATPAPSGSGAADPSGPSTGRGTTATTPSAAGHGTSPSGSPSSTATDPAADTRTAPLSGGARGGSSRS
ncbi:MAG: hypothetical protein PGN11_01395 [Quadrisphaera sp.]